MQEDILWLVELLQNSLFGVTVLPRPHGRTKTKQCGRFKIALWIKIELSERIAIDTQTPKQALVFTQSV